MKWFKHKLKRKATFKNIIFAVMLLPLLVIAITSCTEDEYNFCEVTVVSSEGGTAKIYPDNSTHKIVLGWWVELTATPEQGYRFVNWAVNGKVVSRDNPYKATINTSTQFKANFEKDNFTVKVLSSEGGKATASQEGEVLNGTKVTFTATPNEGYSFVNWTVNGKEVSTKNPYTLTITEDLEIKANFITHKIIVTTSEGGIAEADKTQVGNNEKVTFTATPNEGYSFVNWTVNGKEVSTKNPYTTTITEGISIKANFKALHKVSVIASEGGSANASQTGEVLNSTEVTFTATSQENYGFVNWTVNGKEVSTENPYKVTITDSISIKANFATYKVNVLSSEGGTAKASKTQVGHNAQVTLTATSNIYYEFVNWTVNGEVVSTKNPYTATITADTEFKANFKATKGAENNHEWIDLGLPSGTKWATCNIGADSPEEYGDYFAWGETEPKTTYDWSTYKYCNGSYDTLTKYCTKSSYGTVDNKTTFELSDDAAYVNWGGKWRMPTKTEQDELRNTSNCTWTWTTQNGVKGYKVTSKKNGNSIFLPAAGYRNYDYFNNAGDDGSYWSSSLSTSSSDAYSLFISSSYVGCSSGYRTYGNSVRAVCE